MKLISLGVFFQNIEILSFSLEELVREDATNCEWFSMSSWLTTYLHRLQLNYFLESWAIFSPGEHASFCNTSTLWPSNFIIIKHYTYCQAQAKAQTKSIWLSLALNPFNPTTTTTTTPPRESKKKTVSHHMSQGTYYQAIVVGKFGVNMRVLHPYFPVPHSKYLDLSECFSFW